MPVPTQWCPRRWSLCYTCCPIFAEIPFGTWLTGPGHPHYEVSNALAWWFMRFCSLTCFTCSAHNSGPVELSIQTASAWALGLQKKVASPTCSLHVTLKIGKTFYKTTQVTKLLPRTLTQLPSKPASSPKLNQWYCTAGKLSRNTIGPRWYDGNRNTTRYRKASASTIGPNQNNF